MSKDSLIKLDALFTWGILFVKIKFEGPLFEVSVDPTGNFKYLLAKTIATR